MARGLFSEILLLNKLSLYYVFPKQISPMHSQRCYVSVVELDGLIYALGGFDGKNRLKSAERYDPSTNQWTLISSMNFLRSDAHACTLNGKIYITGK